MWKSVVCAPAATSLVSSATVWLLSRWVHFATRRLAAVPLVATDAWMVSPLEKEVSGVAISLLAPIALPRVTVPEVAAGVAIGTGLGAVGAVSAGVVGGTAGAGSSLRQPTRAAAPTTATSRACERRVWRMVLSSWDGVVRSIRPRRAGGPYLRRLPRSRAA